MSALESLKNYISKIKVLDQTWNDKTSEYLETLAIPQNGLGDLTPVAQKLIAVNKKFSPQVNSKCVVIMAADHGIVDEKVSSLPRVTDTIAKNIMNGSSALSILAESSGCDIKVVDMGIAGDLKSCVNNDNFFSKFINKTGTKNFLKEPAMTKAECIESILTGIEIAEGLSHRYDIFGVGDIGIGNTTSAAALASTILNLEVEKVTVAGSGKTVQHWEHKCEVVKKALKVHEFDKKPTVLTAMSTFGGYEIAAMVGMILGAASTRTLILIDGFTSSVAALCAIKLCPKVHDYLIASHESAEPGHNLMLRKIRLKPLLKLKMRMGQGVGIPLAMNLVENTASLIKNLNKADELKSRENGFLE